MKIYIVRHGQTESNVGNKLLGVTDEDINNFDVYTVGDVNSDIEMIKNIMVML